MAAVGQAGRWRRPGIDHHHAAPGREAVIAAPAAAAADFGACRRLARKPVKGIGADHCAAMPCTDLAIPQHEPAQRRGEPGQRIGKYRRRAVAQCFRRAGGEDQQIGQRQAINRRAAGDAAVGKHQRRQQLVEPGQRRTGAHVAAGDQCASGIKPAQRLGLRQAFGATPGGAIKVAGPGRHRRQHRRTIDLVR